MSSREKRWKGSEIQPAVRCAVYLRGGGRCVYCLTELTKATLQIDHVTPRSEGGSNLPENLVPSCGTCNFRSWYGGEIFEAHLERVGATWAEIDRRIREQTSTPIDRKAGMKLALRRGWYPWERQRRANDRAKRKERYYHETNRRELARREGLDGTAFPFGALAKTTSKGPGLAKTRGRRAA
jgi:hypothetical protein